MSKTGTADPLRSQLANFLSWNEAHASFDAAVEGLPAEFRGAVPRGMPHSAWELVEHIRLTQRDILDFCRDPGYEERSWPADYWPGSSEPSDESAWLQSIEAVRRDRAAMADYISDPDCDLYAPIPHGNGQTPLREVLLVADHTAYHVGQLVSVRQALGAWK
jgi:hypothetical protein